MTYVIRTLMCIQGEKMSCSAREAEGVEALEAAGPEGGDYPDTLSPTDSSEDSVEVRVTAIAGRSKRKCTEPRRRPATAAHAFVGPLKKRVCQQVRAEAAAAHHAAHPFRPWSPRPPAPDGGRFFRPPSSEAAGPVALVVKRALPLDDEEEQRRQQQQRQQAPLRVPPHPAVLLGAAAAAAVDPFPALLRRAAGALTVLEQPTATHREQQQHQQQQPQQQQQQDQQQQQREQQHQQRREQRNYKNMTRERRIEANARERTRVHTISAAFDTLRRAVPAYSHNQKLSKLSVLRIACAYIQTLADVAGARPEAALAASVDTVTRTIQREGKLRKKKDDND